MSGAQVNRENQATTPTQRRVPTTRPYILTVWPPCDCDGCVKPGAGWWDCIRIIPGDRKPIARYSVGDGPATQAQINEALRLHPNAVVVA